MNLPERTRPPGCITDLMFDAWFAGELPTELEPSMENHVFRCDRCRSRRATLAVDRSAFLAQRPNYVASPHQLARRHKRTLFTGVAVGAAALGAIVVLAREPDESAGVPAAAATDLSFMIERGAGSIPGMRGQDVRVGDRIRFEYSTQTPAYLAIYGLDAHGSVHLYHPQTELAAPVGAGAHIPLTESIPVDGVLGTERVFALFCDAAFPVVEPQRTLEVQRSLAPSPGCDVSVTEWDKANP